MAKDLREVAQKNSDTSDRAQEQIEKMMDDHASEEDASDDDISEASGASEEDVGTDSSEEAEAQDTAAQGSSAPDTAASGTAPEAESSSSTPGAEATEKAQDVTEKTPKGAELLRLNADVPPEYHRAVRVEAAKQNIPMREVIMAALEGHLPQLGE